MSKTRSNQLDASADIEAVAKNLLIGSKALGKFPTPVDDIVRFSELAVSQNVDLSALHKGFFSEGYELLQSISRKLVGMVDIRKRIIYLDHQQKPNRQNFVKLHEVGHYVLPWQRDIFLYIDDKESIDSETNEIFEQEASYLASSILFQGSVFDDEAAILELSIKSPMFLAQRFGSSHHAAIRKYVLSSSKRCAVLIFNAPLPGETFTAPLRNCFESTPFLNEFGPLVIQSIYGLEFPFIREMSRKRRLHTEGKAILLTEGAGEQTFSYHFYYNFYNTFVLIIPPGEYNRFGKAVTVGSV